MSVRPYLKFIIHGTISVIVKISGILVSLWVSSREQSKTNLGLGLVTGPL